MRCTICGRDLNVSSDPLSGDCGGDCWGCIGEVEAEAGWQPSLDMVMAEWRKGLRPNWTPPASGGVRDEGAAAPDSAC